MENTGDTYQCNKCEHVWSYEDDACPDCGSPNFSEMEIRLVRGQDKPSEMKC